MERPTFKRVLVPVEFAPANRGDDDAVEVSGTFVATPAPLRRSLEIGAELVAAGGTLTILHASPSFDDNWLYGGPEGQWIPDPTVLEIEARAERNARAFIAALAAAIIPGTTFQSLVASGAAIDVILGYAETWKADLIVLPTSGHGSVHRFFLGSTADKVIRRSRCPVLVV